MQGRVHVSSEWTEVAHLRTRGGAGVYLDVGVSPRTRGPDELEAGWRQRLDARGPAPRAELHVLMLPDFDRADLYRRVLGLP